MPRCRADPTAFFAELRIKATISLRAGSRPSPISAPTTWSMFMTTQTDVAASKSVACLDRYLTSFESRFAERNYKPGTIKTYRALVRRLASFMEAGGIAPEHLTTDLAARLVQIGRAHV